MLFLSDAAPTGYMGADFCNIQPGDTVAVWGCGGVGLMAQQSALLLGAERVIAIDRLPERLALAREHVGAETIDYTQVDSVPEVLKEMTGGRDPDACIDAVGHGGAWHRPAIRLRPRQAAGAPATPTVAGPARAIKACRKGASLSILGVYGVMDKFPIRVIMNKGLTVRTAQRHGQAYMAALLEHAAKGELNPSYLATHKFSLEDGPKGYAMFKHKTDGCVRAVFTP